MATLELGDVVSIKLLDKIPNIMGQAVYDSIMNEGDTGNYILAAILTSIRVQADVYYGLAKHWNKEIAEGIAIPDRKGYPFGLPETFLVRTALDSVKTLAYIQTIYPGVLTNFSARIGPLSYHMYGIVHLLMDYNYDITDHSITIGRVHLPLKRFTLETVDENLPSEKLYVVTAYLDRVTLSWIEIKYLMPDNRHEDYLSVFVTEDGNKRAYIEHMDASLDYLRLTEDKKLKFDLYPIITLKAGKHYITSDDFDTNEILPGITKEQVIRSTDNQLRSIDLKTQDLIDGLSGEGAKWQDFIDHKSSDTDAQKETAAREELRQSKKDRKDFGEALEDAYFLFAADIYSRVPDTVKYLFHFFDELHTENTSLAGVSGSNTLDIYDNIVAGRPDPRGISSRGRFIRRFNMQLSWWRIEKTVKQGTIIPVSELSKKHQYKEVAGEHRYDPVTGEASPALQIALGERIILPQSPKQFPPGTKAVDAYKYDGSTLILRRQLPKVNPTDPPKFEELKINGLTHLTFVTSRKKQMFVVTFLTNRLEQGDTQKFENDRNGFYIPIARNLLLDAPGIIHNSVMYDSVQMITYMVHKIKLTWYQSKWFKPVMIIIAVLLTIWSAGTAIVAIGNLFGVMAVTATLIYIAIVLLTPMLIDLLLTKVGGDLGTALAVIVAIAAMFITGGGSIDAILKLAPMQMTALALNLASTVLNIYNQAGAVELEESVEDFLEEREEQEKELDRLESLLDDDHLALIDTSPFIDYEYGKNTAEIETLDTLIDRNFAFLNANFTIDIVSDYVDLSLTLPTTLKL